MSRTKKVKLSVVLSVVLSLILLLVVIGAFGAKKEKVKNKDEVKMEEKIAETNCEEDDGSKNRQNADLDNCEEDKESSIVKEEENKDENATTAETAEANENDGNKKPATNDAKSNAKSKSSQVNTASRSTQQKKQTASKPSQQQAKPKSQSKSESKPKPQPKPSKPTGFDTALTNEINKSHSSASYRGSKLSLYDNLVRQLASGKTSVSGAKSQISKEFVENGETYQPTNVQVYTITSKTGNPNGIASKIKPVAANTAYRKISVYYNANTKTYTVGVIALGFYIIGEWEPID